MKKRLLFFLTCALAAIGIQAQSWTAPTLPYSAEAIPSAAYFYHVGQQMFLTKGTTWGTHAALTKDASAAFLYELQEQSEGVYKLHSASAANTGFLGRSTETELYTDFNNQGAWSTEYELYKAESGFYHIRTSATSTNFGANNYVEGDLNYGLFEMGWDANNIDVDKSGNSLDTNIGIFMIDPTNESAQLDWAFVTTEAFTVYSAQKSLYDKLVEAYETGYSESELSEYAALLTSTDTEALKTASAAVAQLILNYAYNHATPESPFEITAVIQNPTFEGTRGTEPEGWTDDNGNMLIQNNSSYLLYDDENATTSTEYGLNNFAQNWTSSSTEPIAASNIHQTINDLPQGTYRLTADCIATSASASLQVSGAALYATSGSVNYSTPIDRYQYGAPGSGNPHRYALEITHFGGDLTIGYGFQPGYAKWFAVDNFRLYYCGPVDNPGLLALSSTYDAAKVYSDEYDETYIFSASTLETLNSELSDAEDIMGSGNSDDCITEAETLGNLINSIKEEISVYTQFKNLVDQVTSDAEKFVEIEGLGDELADMRDEYQGAYEDRTASVEDINKWIEAYNPFVIEGLKAAMANATEENPIEITAFGTNMNYADNNDKGWTHSSTTGHWNTRAHCAEVWNSNFNCYQIIENMPAGKYILRANSFYRTAANDVMTEEDEIKTVLYVNKSTAPVVNLSAGWSETAYYADDYQDENTLLYLPNSMEGAEVAFNRGLYACEVSGYLTEDGNLTIGIKNEGDILTNAWSIWSNFRLFYCGKSNSALYDQVLALVTDAQTLQDKVSIISEADSKLNDAQVAADAVGPESSEDELMGVIEQLNNAIAYGNEGLGLVSKVIEQYNAYNETMATVESSDEAFPALLEEISNAISDEEFVSNKKMNEWLGSLAKSWTAYIQYDHLNATKDAPEDITAVIVNPSFDQGTNNTNGATGWTFKNDNGSSGHIGYNNTTQQEGSNFAYEYWSEAAFDMYQTIVGLAEGYYHLTVNGLYRAGNNDPAVVEAYEADPASARDMSFYAQTSELYSVPMKSVYDDAQTEDPAADGEGTATLNGATVYVPNTMISAGAFFTNGLYVNELDVYVKEGEDLTIGLRLDGNVVNSNWCVFDNFTISYLGNGEENAPDAVESVVAKTNASQSIFDLMGRRVNKAQKGIYIINGRKMVVK